MWHDERGTILYSIAKMLARAKNPEIAAKKFVEALKAEMKEIQNNDKENVA